MGLPFKHRNHFMPTLCERARVKPFGFHAMRHKSAEVVFVSKGLNDTQILMGHSRATTTDLYVRSAGLYADKSMIPTALGEHTIGQSAIKLMEMEIRCARVGAAEQDYAKEKKSYAAKNAAGFHCGIPWM